MLCFGDVGEAASIWRLSGQTAQVALDSIIPSLKGKKKSPPLTVFGISYQFGVSQVLRQKAHIHFGHKTLSRL